MASVFGGIAGISALVLPLILASRPRAGVSGDPPPPPAQLVPDWVVDRAEAEQVVAAVCRRGRGRRDSAAVGITTALDGAGGFGKTMLARVACAHPKVRRHFKGRIYVVTIGRDVRGRVAIAAKVAETIRFITGDTLEVGQDPEQAGDHLGRLLAERPRTLMVIDDVWEPEQLEPFLRGARDQCVRLVTTRVPAVLPSGTSRVTVDRMSPAQARAVLTHDLRPAPPNDMVNALLKQTGRWALLLRMVNQVVVAQAATGADVREAARHVLDRLRAMGPAGQDPAAPLDLDDPHRRNSAVRASIQAATTLLPPDGDRRFTELGIFTEDETVPLSLVAMLWQATSGLDEPQVRTLCKQMADLSLCTLDTAVRGGTLALHDVVRDYLRAELASDLPSVNAALVDAVAATLPADADHTSGAGSDAGPVPRVGAAWWQARDGYLRDHLIEHLVDAGRTSQAEAVASHFEWVRARLDQRGPTAPPARPGPPGHTYRPCPGQKPGSCRPSALPHNAPARPRRGPDQPYLGGSALADRSDPFSGCSCPHRPLASP
ncbi:NB-ARC domain-containing protein [Streptomyces sp. NPDC004111]|uniref:NB-ARC domain-containing protein n=1 Tax=Streptomyces sp. NPDC004111 TaxID=3364690 RepID=UPI00367387D3